MAMIKTTTDRAGQIHGIKVLIYGSSGIGKTRLAETAPKPIILSAEAGVLSLRNSKIPMLQLSTVDDFIEAFEWAQSNKEADAFETIYIDSLSEIAEVVLSNAKAQVKDPRQAYGELLEKMVDTVRKFRDLPGKHVVMTAKMEPFKDDLTGVVTYIPMMPGSKLGPQLPYLFDEVFRMGTNKTPEGKEYTYLQTRRDLQYEAKDRSGSLEPIEKPDLNYIFDKILRS